MGGSLHLGACLALPVSQLLGVGLLRNRPPLLPWACREEELCFAFDQVPPDANDLIEMLDSQTLLLNYASMEMEKTLALLEEQAESNLLVLSEEVEKLQEEIHGNRRRLQRRNDSKISQMLDIQLEVLDPVAELCAHFEEAYRHFATTLDLTRHELPMKALTVGETNAQDLGREISHSCCGPPQVKGAAGSAAVEVGAVMGVGPRHRLLPAKRTAQRSG
ncbi:HAUS augmin-like complex subunit 8 [Varanus komodoensis]|nr:HAUS augmin-like complex subunit 8 [Varanus komodoensis]